MQAADSAPAEVVFQRLAHDLRNGLGAILGWVAVLKRAPGATPLMLQGIEAIERNAQLQYTALEDLLDSARLSTGQLKLNMSELEPAAVARAALDEVRLHAFRCGVVLKPARISDPACVVADEPRLRRVVATLLRSVIDALPRGAGVQLGGKITDGSYEIRIGDAATSAATEAANEKDQPVSAPLPSTLTLAAQLVQQHHGSLFATDGGAGPPRITLRLPLARTA